MEHRVFDRRHERIERINDQQDRMMLNEDRARCDELKARFNATAMKLGEAHKAELAFRVPVPRGTSETALLCFTWATRRVGEVPTVHKNEGGEATSVEFAGRESK